LDFFFDKTIKLKLCPQWQITAAVFLESVSFPISKPLLFNLSHSLPSRWRKLNFTICEEIFIFFLFFYFFIFQFWFHDHRIISHSSHIICMHVCIYTPDIILYQSFQCISPAILNPNQPSYKILYITMRLTPDLIRRSQPYLNPLGQREIGFRSMFNFSSSSSLHF